MDLGQQVRAVLDDVLLIHSDVISQESQTELADFRDLLGMEQRSLIRFLVGAPETYRQGLS